MRELVKRWPWHVATVVVALVTAIALYWLRCQHRGRSFLRIAPEHRQGSYVATDAERRTKRLFMVAILLTATLLGGYIGKVMRSSSDPLPSRTADPVQPPQSQ